MNSDFARLSGGVSIRISSGRWRTRFTMWTLAAALITIAGCSQPADPWTRAPASGQVTLDGEPLSEGTITFFPSGATKGPAAGGPIVNGRYEIPAEEGPVVGTNRIEIRSVQKTGRIVKPPMAVETTGPAIEQVEELRQIIPPRYNRDSTIEFTITAGVDNVNDLNIETAPSKRP